MNDMEKRKAARDVVIAKFLKAIDENEGEQFDECSWAFPTDVEGQEIWVEMSFKAKAFKDTQRSKAFDPFVAAEEWHAIQVERAQKKAERDAKKAQKTAKTKANEKEDA